MGDDEEARVKSHAIRHKARGKVPNNKIHKAKRDIAVQVSLTVKGSMPKAARLGRCPPASEFFGLPGLSHQSQPNAHMVAPAEERQSSCRAIMPFSPSMSRAPQSTLHAAGRAWRGRHPETRPPKGSDRSAGQSLWVSMPASANAGHHRPLV